MTLGQTLRDAWNKAYAQAMEKPDKRLPEWQQQENAGFVADEAAAHAVTRAGPVDESESTLTVDAFAQVLP